MSAMSDCSCAAHQCPDRWGEFAHGYALTSFPPPVGALSLGTTGVANAPQRHFLAWACALSLRSATSAETLSAS